MDEFMTGLAEGMVMGLLGASGSGGCAVDYTTPNPTRCRLSRYSGPATEHAYRPETPRPTRRSKTSSTFKCFTNGVPYISKTYKLGCYSLHLEQPGTRLSDVLSQIK